MTTEDKKLEEHKQIAKDLQDSIAEAVTKFWSQTGIIVKDINIDWYDHLISRVNIEMKYF